MQMMTKADVKALVIGILILIYFAVVGAFCYARYKHSLEVKEAIKDSITVVNLSNGGTRTFAAYDGEPIQYSKKQRSGAKIDTTRKADFSWIDLDNVRGLLGNTKTFKEMYDTARQMSFYIVDDTLPSKRIYFVHSITRDTVITTTYTLTRWP